MAMRKSMLGVIRKDKKNEGWVTAKNESQAY